VSQENVWDLGPSPIPLGPEPPSDSADPQPHTPHPPVETPSEPSPAAVPVTGASGVPASSSSHVPAAPAAAGVPASARKVFDSLLDVGAPRPVARADTVDRVIAAFDDAGSHVKRVWSESSMSVGKSALASLARCEGNALALRATSSSSSSSHVSTASALGQVTHKAVQMSWTHPGRDVGVYVREAIAGCCAESQEFDEFWSTALLSSQSDVMASATVRVTAFVDTFPPLLDEWSPRFEEPMVARLGPIVLTGRPDLVMGRPRDAGRRTMFVCDFKSGDVTDEHVSEAQFYAVLATVRYGVVPWRTTVFSLASGMWTPSDFSDDEVVEAAERVAAGVSSLCDVWTESRPALLTQGRWCRWCPAKVDCPAVTKDS
jgi:hypothetical protein